MSETHQAGFLISKIQKISQQVFQEKLSENGLKIHPGQGSVLYVLWKNGDNIPIKDLVEKTGLPKTTLTSILDRLENSGEIIRLKSTIDKREINVKISKKNFQGKHEIYQKVSEEMEAIFYKGFSEEEKSQLDKYLNRLLKNLEEA